MFLVVGATPRCTLDRARTKTTETCYSESRRMPLLTRLPPYPQKWQTIPNLPLLLVVSRGYESRKMFRFIDLPVNYMYVRVYRSSLAHPRARRCLASLFHPLGRCLTSRWSWGTRGLRGYFQARGRIPKTADRKAPARRRPRRAGGISFGGEGGHPNHPEE